jgi:hypothetical protein
MLDNKAQHCAHKPCDQAIPSSYSLNLNGSPTLLTPSNLQHCTPQLLLPMNCTPLAYSDDSCVRHQPMLTPSRSRPCSATQPCWLF